MFWRTEALPQTLGCLETREAGRGAHHMRTLFY
jgi:hypothetical protein